MGKCCVVLGVRKADHRERDERYVFSMRSFQTGLDPKLSHQTAGWPISDGTRNFKGSKRGGNFGTLGERCLRRNSDSSGVIHRYLLRNLLSPLWKLRKAKFTLRHIQEVLNLTYIIIERARGGVAWY